MSVEGIPGRLLLGGHHEAAKMLQTLALEV